MKWLPLSADMDGTTKSEKRSQRKSLHWPPFSTGNETKYKPP